MRIAWRLLEEEASRARALAAGLLASLTATVAHGLIDNAIFLVDLSFVWMMSLGVLAVLWRQRVIPRTGQEVRHAYPGDRGSGLHRLPSM